MPSDFSVEVKDSKKANTKVLALSGELDEYSLDTLKKEVDVLLADTNVIELIFDLAKLEFLNSKGIGYVVSVHTHLTKDSRSMAITGANEPVMDVISLVGLTSIIPYFNTVEEAEVSA